MPDSAWSDPAHRTFQMLRSGVPWGDRDALVIINANLQDVTVTLPRGHDLDWLVAMNTVWDSPDDGGIGPRRDPRDLGLDVEHIAPRSEIPMQALSMMVLLSDVAAHVGR